MKELAGVLRFVAACAYLWLAIRLFWSRETHRYMMAAVYCSLMVFDLVWNPQTVPQLLLIEPTLLGFRFCAVLEAASAATELISRVGPNVRRHMLLGGIALGFPAAATTRGLFVGDTPMTWYYSVRQSANVWIAMMSLCTCLLYFLDRPGLDRRVRRHYICLTLYLIVLAATGFTKPVTWEEYYTLRVSSLALTGAAVAIWITLLPRRA